MLKDTERHHSDLNIFAAIQAILEGGVLYTRPGQRMAERVIKLCKQEQQAQLRAYDKANATAKATTAS